MTDPSNQGLVDGNPMAPALSARPCLPIPIPRHDRISPPILPSSSSHRPHPPDSEEIAPPMSSPSNRLCLFARHVRHQRQRRPHPRHLRRSHSPLLDSLASSSSSSSSTSSSRSASLSPAAVADKTVATSVSAATTVLMEAISRAPAAKPWDGNGIGSRNGTESGGGDVAETKDKNPSAPIKVSLFDRWRPGRGRSSAVREFTLTLAWELLLRNAIASLSSYFSAFLRSSSSSSFSSSSSSFSVGTLPFCLILLLVFTSSGCREVAAQRANATFGNINDNNSENNQNNNRPNHRNLIGPNVCGPALFQYCCPGKPRPYPLSEHILFAHSNKTLTVIVANHDSKEKHATIEQTGGYTSVWHDDLLFD